MKKNGRFYDRGFTRKIPDRLKTNDKVAIVSLSSGILGETFAKHELEIGLRRLREYGLEPVIMEML